MTLKTRHRLRLHLRLPVVALALCCAAPIAHVHAAEGGSADKLEADRLFTEGKQRLELRDYAQACPLLARSFALDPATGALLALAACHERANKLASAFGEYTEAAARSQREQRADREQAARAKAAALAPKLSTLRLTLAAADAPVAEVRLNGQPVESARLSGPIAVDGGDQLIEVSAPGKQPFRIRVSVADSIDAQTVAIPELTPQPQATTPPPPAAAALTPAPPAPAVLPAPVAVQRRSPPPRAQDRGLSGEQWVGLGTMGLGVVGLGMGTYLVVKDEPAEKADCEAPRCFTTEPSDPDDAGALAFVAGGVLAVTGLVIYLIHGSSSGSTDESSAANARSQRASVQVERVRAWAAPAAAGMAVDARF